MSMFVDIIYADWVDIEDPTNREFIIKWNWNDPRPAGFGGIENSTTDHFEVMWMYSTLIQDPAEIRRTGQREVWHGDATTTQSISYVPGQVDLQNSKFNVPENAISIQARIQPFPKTQNGSGQSVEPWRGGITWSGAKSVEKGLKPERPENVTIEQLSDFPNQVVASVSNIKTSNGNKNVVDVEFQLMRFDTKPFFYQDTGELKTEYTVTKTEKVSVTQFDSAGVVWDLEDDHYYTIRARYLTSGGAFSPWSIPKQENIFVSPPFAPIIQYTRLETKSSISIYYTYSKLTSGNCLWQFTLDRGNFSKFDTWVNNHPDADDETRKAALLNCGVTEGSYVYGGHATIDVQGNSGNIHFRIRTYSPEINGIVYPSGWSDTVTHKFGSKPLPPTIWNTKPYAYIGVDTHIRLYVMHNSADNTVATKMFAWGAFAEDMADDLHMLTPAGGAKAEDYMVSKDGNTFWYDVDISHIKEECPFLWIAATSDGIERSDDIDSNPYCEPIRVDIYKKPELSIIITNVVPDSQEDVPIVDSFPIQYETNITMGADHTVTAYKVMVVANEPYETTMVDGHVKHIRAGDSLYEKYIFKNTNLYEQLNASEISLENGITYTMHIIATLSTSASCEAEYVFKTKYELTHVQVMASMFLNKDDMSMSINPLVRSVGTDSWVVLTDYALGIYRINDDGTMVTIAENVPSRESIYITDPHPNLRDACYRITATPTKGKSNKVEFYDTAPYPVNCSDIILQWDEVYYDTYIIKDVNNLNRNKSVSGSILRLPFNIDVSESTNLETNLVNYVGRKDPVAYFGTHTGYTAQWSAEIPKSDIETIKMLRRLQVYMGNVYVREPSGTGYWAMVKVTFPVNHCALTVNVSLDITRVEGGK